MLITRRHGSWVVLGTLVTTAELEATPPARRGVRLLHALHRRLPDRRARGGGRARRDALPLVLDAVGRPLPRGVPRGARRPRLRLRHLPGRLPVEPRSREAAGGGDGRERGATRLADRLAAGGRRRARRALRPPLRAAQRPALPATERARRARQRRWRPVRWPSPTPRATTRCCASTRSGRFGGSAERRAAAPPGHRALDRVGPARRGPAGDLPGRNRPALPGRPRALGVAYDRSPRGRRDRHLRAQPARPDEAGAPADRARGARLRLRDRLGLHADLQLRGRLARSAR